MQTLRVFTGHSEECPIWKVSGIKSDYYIGRYRPRYSRGSPKLRRTMKRWHRGRPSRYIDRLAPQEPSPRICERSPLPVSAIGFFFFFLDQLINVPQVN